MTLTVHPFFETSSSSYGFIVANPESGCCAVVDPPLGVTEQDQVNTHCADLMLDWVAAQRYTVRWILETHVHADRPSAAGYLKQHLLCAQLGIGASTPNVHGYDRLLAEGDKICLGHACGRVLATPGHSPGSVSYQFEDFVFVGDTLFIPDAGTARCDAPGACAASLYQSIQALLTLPDDTRLFVSHDYGAAGRRKRFVTTVAEEKAQNIHVGRHACMEEFVALRIAEDRALVPPRWFEVAVTANEQCLLPQSVQALFVGNKPMLDSANL